MEKLWGLAIRTEVRAPISRKMVKPVLMKPASSGGQGHHAARDLLGLPQTPDRDLPDDRLRAPFSGTAMTIVGRDVGRDRICVDGDAAARAFLCQGPGQAISPALAAE